MKEVLGVVLGLVVAGTLMYGLYWVGKSLSYTIFYQDMVREEIREMVKEGSLR